MPLSGKLVSNPAKRKSNVFEKTHKSKSRTRIIFCISLDMRVICFIHWRCGLTRDFNQFLVWRRCVRAIAGNILLNIQIKIDFLLMSEIIINFDIYLVVKNKNLSVGLFRHRLNCKTILTLQPTFQRTAFNMVWCSN